jgi:hypothetical protein
MGTLMIKCPKTGSAISTGIQMGQSTFNNTPVFFARTLCPICQIQHEWFARAAWVRQPKAHDYQPVKLARTNRWPPMAIHQFKWVIIAAIFAVAGVTAGFTTGPAAINASPVSGSAVGTATSSPVAYKSTSHAITFPEVNRMAKDNRLPVLIPDDRVGPEQSDKDRSNRSIQKGMPREVERTPVAHCEPISSPISDPAIVDVPGRCFAQLGAFRRTDLPRAS